MTKIVPDTEQIRFLRRKSLLFSTRVIGLMLLGGAAYRFYDVGLQQEWWPVVYVGIGSSLLTGSLCFSLFGPQLPKGGEDN